MNWKIESAITVHFDALFSSCSVCSTVFHTERYRKIRCESLASETQTVTCDAQKYSIPDTAFLPTLVNSFFVFLKTLVKIEQIRHA